MNEESDSVFQLVNKLCKSYCPKKSKSKLMRIKCYEKLLGKTELGDPRKFQDLKGLNDPMINLLAWSFQIKHNYSLPEVAKELQEIVDQLKDTYSTDLESFNRILTFLLCLKDVPKKVEKILDLSTLPKIDENEMEVFNNLFKLPCIHKQNDIHAEEIFKMSHEALLFQNNLNPIKSASDNINNIENNNNVKDEGYSSPDLDNNNRTIWDVVSEMKISLRKNWESYGCGPPDKEKPFLSELGDLSSLWVENLETLYIANNLFPSFTIMSNKLKSRTEFIKDLKYLLVGIPSDSFTLSAKEEFWISLGIMIEGITPDAMERFCSNFIFSGNCYRALNKLASSHGGAMSVNYRGYIFSEFCQSLAKYLQFYRTAIMSISDNTTFLNFHETTYKIQFQLTTLSSICKVGPFEFQHEQTPKGIALLNYLYQKVLTVTDEKLSMVLYSILYPCCQVYFSRFLYQWIVRGQLNDPYGEFFIFSNLKYQSTLKGRVFWSKSFQVIDDQIPDFLIDLKDDILFCGRLMNLLQVCNPKNKLCLYLKGKNRLVLSCCFTQEKLMEIERSCSLYYLEASEECGSKFNFSEYLNRNLENDVAYQELLAQKRFTTLKRIELERQQLIQEQREKKLEELQSLKEQYESAIELKELKVYKEIEKEINTMEDDMKIEQVREKLIEEEAAKMIDYYEKLTKIAETRQEQIKNHTNQTVKMQIDSAINKERPSTLILKEVAIIDDKRNSSSESFYSIPEDEDEPVNNSKCENENNMHSSESTMDIINANHTETEITVENSAPIINSAIQQAIDNFAFAKKIKQKILNQELGINTFNYFQPSSVRHDEEVVVAQNLSLTDAQKNKLKVLSSEFGINTIINNDDEMIMNNRTLTAAARVNKNKILGSSACFHPILDNEYDSNKNTSAKLISTGLMKKSKSLQLELDKSWANKSDSDKLIVPMSVDSTPLSDLPQILTPSTDFPSCTTPLTNMTDSQHTDDFLQTSFLSKPILFEQTTQRFYSIPKFSNKVSAEESKEIFKNSLKLFLHESVAIPVLTQLRLANNEMLKYFIQELNYTKHLLSLRDYFFLQNGEFGRNITENLFEKLYNANFPMELINCSTLQYLVFSALEVSSKFQENSQYLSFKINNLPKCFDLGDPDVLDCLSLNYKINFPLDILISSEAISKYDQVFKFLLKVNRLSWILKKIFLELKILAKETGKKEIYLMSSPHYKKLHQYRHVMTHFMQTFQNYIVGEVLQPSWAVFENNLTKINNIDELYHAHTLYIKDILFRCLLNQKSVVLRNVIQKIFVVILKFYDYLRSRTWRCENGYYVHPNFEKLEKIFNNFEEFVLYFFKAVKKGTKNGYQPHLIQFLDILNVNDYYSKQIK